MLLSPKTRLGSYEILGLLGTGGMGVVYRAKDLRLGREVAVKVLPAEVASSQDRLARFEREARTVAGLNHPNIVTLLSFEDEDGIRFLTMELVEGESLTTLIAHGGMPFARLLELSIPLADALAAAHERGVIHRDLKPGNVIVTRDGRVKVLDFGLAKIVSTDVSPDAGTVTARAKSATTAVGQVLGTVPYMAPEQIRGETADTRTDLFALGIILYELATGRRPFAGHTAADITSSILRDTPAPLSHARTGCPGDLERIVSRCLEKNPRQRFQTALDVSNELRRLLHILEHAQPERHAAKTTASIAVLPFVNRSASAEDEYFSDGLADELLNMLAKIRGLRVAARTSTFHFKGKDATIAEVGSALNVATVLEGSVRKVGNRARISVQLVKVADGYHLWSGAYDRTLEDILAVQDDIAQSVVRELRTMLLGEEADPNAKAEIAAAAKGHGRNPEAHRLYLQGKYFVERFNQDDVARGIGYLNEAVALAPTHAAAWCALARAHSLSGGLGWSPIVAGYERARDAVTRALELAPELAEAHEKMGAIQRMYDWNWRAAEASIRRALELSPGSATALAAAGELAGQLRRFTESEEFLRRAIDQDPLNAGCYRALGMVHRAMDRLPEAEGTFRKALEVAPQRVACRYLLAIVLADQGNDTEALVEAKREPMDFARLTGLAYVHHTAGRKQESDEALRHLEERHGGGSFYQIASIHASRGGLDAAFNCLDRAFDARDSGLAHVNLEPMFHRLYGDPRWGAFMKKMGIEE